MDQSSGRRNGDELRKYREGSGKEEDVQIRSSY